MKNNKIPPIVEFQKYLDKNYDFRYNQVTGRTEYKHKNSSTENSYTNLSDREVNSIIFEMQAQKLSINKSTFDLIVKSHNVRSYDPLQEYFLNLPEHDGGDYIEALSETIRTTDDEYWKWAFKKWIVAMVASIMDDSVVNHQVLVFHGNKGLGKTTWIENLVPSSLEQYGYTGTVSPGNKDTLAKLSECMLINLDELENLNRKSKGGLKMLITQPSINIRRPYEKYSESSPHRASFAGSVNTSQFLTDRPTRRFVCHTVLEIDYKHGVDINLVYSQALNEYRKGEYKYWFEKNDIQRVYMANEKYEIRSLAEEYLLKYFRKPTIHDAGSKCLKYMTSSDILNSLRNRAGLPINNLNSVVLGRELSANGFNRVSKYSKYCYEVVEVTDEEVAMENQTQYFVE